MQAMNVETVQTNKMSLTSQLIVKAAELVSASAGSPRTSKPSHDKSTPQSHPSLQHPCLVPGTHAGCSWTAFLHPLDTELAPPKSGVSEGDSRVSRTPPCIRMALAE